MKLGFKFDNVIMEEAAQALDIESLIPIMLQDIDNAGESSRLKRIVLIGYARSPKPPDLISNALQDAYVITRSLSLSLSLSLVLSRSDHHQLPPVVKNMALQKYAHLDQSLFTRLVRLQVPAIQLDAQGRCRPALAELFNWRYKSLRNLESVVAQREFQHANAGFAFDYQMINVEDYNGFGEHEPTPHFYQNLGEAEYIVALYMWMRLLGYVPSRRLLACMLACLHGSHAQRDAVSVAILPRRSRSSRRTTARST